MKVDPQSLNEAKDKLIKKLDEYKNYILINLNNLDKINIEIIYNDIKQNVGKEEAKFFNVHAFLRKINQNIRLSRKRDIRLEFTQYYITLDDRIKQIKEPTPVEHEDGEFEKEKSLLSRKRYEREKYIIQVELLKLQEWVKKTGARVAIVFEGRDSAGKGSTIKRFIEYLDPKGYRIVALGVPTDEERENWFPRYEKELPQPGEIVFFDRSWYNRAVVEPVMGYCTEEQYKEFMDNVNDWEKNLVNEGVILIKLWFSISKEKQQQRFNIRQSSPLKYWKFSPNDAKVTSKWDLIGNYKNQMFNHTSTEYAPWTIINSNDKKIGRLNAMRYVLSVIDYDDKDEAISQYYPEVVNTLK